MPIVSTGQITIVDTNDARTITAVLTASGGTQQVYTKDESTLSYTPSWFSTPLVLTPQIAIGGLTTTQTWAALSNRQFALTAGGTAITAVTTSTSFVNNSDAAVSTPYTTANMTAGVTSPSTLTITGNLKDTVANFTIFFDADYTDATTGLSTHITCQITLNTIKTGTNAVFIVLRGQTAFEEATGQTKTVIAVAADLVRSGGIDTTGLTYKWYEAGGGTQVTSSLSGVATKYGLKTTSAGTTPTAATGDLNVNIPTASGNTHNTLVISEAAVTDIGIYKVEITDAESKTFTAYFTIYDISDPYDVQVLSSTGDKLQNGQGSTSLTPVVYTGSTQVTDLTGWTFTWYFYDKNGKRGAFVDTGKISTAGGATISANTTGSSATFTYGGTSYAFSAGMIIKCVKPNGDAFFYEVASSTTNQVTIRAASTNSPWLSSTFADFAAPVSSSDFVGGKLFGCVTNGHTSTGGTRSTSGGAAIVLSGDDVDVKSRILVDANRP
jgi:hypothetical protein